MFDDMTTNESTCVSRVADREKLPLLLDKARQFAGEYIDSLEERPVFPSEKSLRAMHALIEPLPENPINPFVVTTRQVPWRVRIQGGQISGITSRLFRR